RRAKRQVVYLPRQAGLEVPRLLRKRSSATPQHRALLVAQPCPAHPLLRPDLAPGAVHFGAVLRGAGALAGAVAFEDDGAVQEVAPEGEREVRGRVGGETDGFEVREGVERCEDGWGRNV
ncbi:MAG: hypothetical protein Q9157_005948, partial [Trypethelium eluteriae]